MATLFTQRQHKLSHFFATENDGGAEKKKRIENAKEIGDNKKKTSLNKYFGKKN